MSNAEFVASLSQERNRGFNTAVGTADRIGQEHHTGVRVWGAERDGRAGGKAAPVGADGGSRQDHTP